MGKTTVAEKKHGPILIATSNTQSNRIKMKIAKILRKIKLVYYIGFSKPDRGQNRLHKEEIEASGAKKNDRTVELQDIQILRGTEFQL